MRLSRSASRRRTSCPGEGSATARGGHRRRGARAPTRTSRGARSSAAPARCSTSCWRRPASPARTSSSPTWSRRARPATATRRADEVAHCLPLLEAQLEVIAPAAARAPRPPRARRTSRRAPRSARSTATSSERDGRDAVPAVPPRRGAAQPAPADDAGRRRAGAEAGAVNPVRVGCCGWNYADWRGRALPAGLPPAALARALRRGLRHRRGQRHLLPAADARGGRAAWVDADAAGLRLRRSRRAAT